jgi:hypothetical protein
MALSPAAAARVRNRLDAVADLVPRAVERTSLSSSPPEHFELFRNYVAELRRVRARAEAWWEDLLASELERVGDRDEAKRNVESRRPAGCAVHPAVIAVIRAFWLACAALNERLGAQQRIAPEQLVLGWLVQAGDDALAEFVSTLPFWPLGLDSAGRWV